jgi:mannose-6-phosphate isomerase
VIVCPAHLEPIFSRRPWGALSLAPFFPEKSKLAEPIGEAWMSGVDCVFADGAFAGKKLGDAWRVMPQEWTGTSVDREEGFPILVKFIFPEDKLSVQVHPGDDYAARHEQAAGGRGKTEMWYAVRARPGAEVMVGLKPDVTLDTFKRAIAAGTAEKCLEHVPVITGDAIFVPAGTAHTIGPGLVLCEIQEYSDLTYRVYDYNRRDAGGLGRALHVDKALDVMRFGKQAGGKIEAVRVERGAATETYFAACRYFATEKWEFTKSVVSETSRAHFELLVFLDGAGVIRWDNQSVAYTRMQVWMMPAGLGAFELVPASRTELLRTYVPGEPSEFFHRLRDRGVPEAAASRLVHP